MIMITKLLGLEMEEEKAATMEDELLTATVPAVDSTPENSKEFANEEHSRNIL